MVGTGKLYPTPDENSEALDSNLKFTKSGDGSWYIESGTDREYYYDGDAVQSDHSLTSGKESVLQTIVDIGSTETVKFHWKVSCQTSYNYLRFYIDDTLKNSIIGDTDWTSKEYTVPACYICFKSLIAGRSKGSGPVARIIAVVGENLSC
ncbi:hypothetical protein ACFL3Q_06365 [Planctomycetota bacterium]